MDEIISTEPKGTGIRPVIRIQPGRHKRVRGGHPWVFSNEIEMTGEAKDLAPGTIVSLVDAGGGAIGTAMFNPQPLISARLLSREMGVDINADWLADRIARASTLRNRFFDRPYYRLVNAEADGLPGLIIDQYSDVCVVQLNTAGMEALGSEIVTALQQTLSPVGIVIQRNGKIRQLEGLNGSLPEIVGTVSSPLTILENGMDYLVDVTGGQKTGWFFDHRENRARAASLSVGRRMADIYCYLGGFGLQAAAAGATEVVCVDRSQHALDLAARTAKGSGLENRCRFEKSEAFTALEQLSEKGEKFDVVVADPPAFVKSKKDLKPGARGYRKLARLAAEIVESDGILCIASCSYHIDVSNFAEQVGRGIRDAGRTSLVFQLTGAGPDHPVHPHLPESSYLKCLFLQLD